MNNLKLLRTQKGLSQQKLAELLNTSQQCIYKYENGLSEPDIQTMKKMAEIFDTSIDYLVGNTENPKKNDFYTETELNEQELRHLRLYRRLSSYRQHLMDALMQDYENENHHR